jgi:hypothetical protein
MEDTQTCEMEATQPTFNMVLLNDTEHLLSSFDRTTGGVSAPDKE